MTLELEGGMVEERANLLLHGYQLRVRIAQDGSTLIANSYM